jgi:hypothetical protein
VSYTQSFSEDKYASIQVALDQLPGLEAGGEVTLSNLNLHEVGHIRWLVYDYLHHMGVKNQFRMRTDWERKALVIRRLGVTSHIQIDVNRSGLARGLDSVLQKLVALDNLQQAEDELGKMLAQKEIAPEDMGKILLELRRIFS